MEGSRWVVGDPARSEVVALARELGVPPLLAQLMLLRGIKESGAGRRFLNPGGTPLSDPFELTDMEPAVDRLHFARQEGEHVHVFGDYDVDGMCGAVILLEGLRRFGIKEVTCGIPDRLSGGYGIRPESVDAIRESGASLIVTADNGVSALEAASRCRELGVDLIVTDHHELDAELPEALAVINPRRDGPSCAMYESAGAAVAYKLLHALTRSTHGLDLAALGTVADLMPLSGENRDLVHLGIEQMRRWPRPGIDRLCAVAKRKASELTSEDIAFQIAPRLNAVARLGRGELALDLLQAEEQRAASRLAALLDAANKERREIEQDLADEILEALDGGEADADGPAIVLGNRGWHAGVIGIVASRVQRVHPRPIVLVSFDEDGAGRGSVRGVDGFDVAGALAECAPQLVRHGGHEAAGGFTVAEDRFEAFREAFLAAAARQLDGAEPCESLHIDAITALSQIDGKFLSVLERLQPFGRGNPAPLMCSYGVGVAQGSVRELRGGHLRFAVTEGPRVVNCVAFRMAEKADVLQGARRLDIAYTPQLNSFRGEKEVQLLIRDVKPGTS